jgi:predicted adenine nucleotide alpha hydrolase (AANH) superfamily ATPase
MKRLLHVCCANCLSDIVKEIGSDGAEIVLYFANPNIHPLVEFRKRRKSVRLLAERLGLRLVEEPYGLHTYLDAVAWAEGDPSARCATCYRLRLGAAAKMAATLGASSFTTTLLVSRQQDRNAIVRAGGEAASDAGVGFDSPDLRSMHGCDAARPKDLKLYKQSYCGCVFSEEERFRDSTRGE